MGGNVNGVGGPNNVGGPINAGYYTSFILKNPSGKLETFYFPLDTEISMLINGKKQPIKNSNNTYTVDCSSQDMYDVWHTCFTRADKNHDNRIDEYDGPTKGHVEETIKKNGKEYEITVYNKNGVSDKTEVPKGYKKLEIANSESQNTFTVFIPQYYILRLPAGKHKLLIGKYKNGAILTGADDSALKDLWNLVGGTDSDKNREITPEEIEAYNKAHPNSPYKFVKIKK